MATIYLWHANIAQGEVGHVSMRLSDGTYISHWPADEKKKFSTVRGDKYTFNDDIEVEGRQPDESLDLPAGMLKEDAIRKWWTKYGGHYNVVQNNCAQVVYKALLEGGVADYAGTSAKSQPILTPRDVVEFARYCKNCYERGGAPRKNKKKSSS